VEFRILGPLEVVEDGNPVALGTLKERLVLGVLLLHANEFVSRERLIDDLWGEAPPPTARKAINVYVSQLRKALGLGGADPIATASGGYRLQVESDAVDSVRLERLLAEARAAIARGDQEEAAGRYADALALWRGPTLAGLPFESRGRDEVARLDELRITALMDRIDCDLALGRQEEVLGELNVLVREHPLRERLRAQQMLALYRADRQAEALEAYAEARQILVEDLGIEPSEALQRLQQAILRHDPSLETPEGTASANGYAPSEPALSQPPAAQPEQLEERPRFRVRRWQLVLAAVVILSGVAAAAAALSSSAGAHIVPNSLVELNPRTGKPIQVARVGSLPGPMAITPNAIWTVNYGSDDVSRYDLRTHEVDTRGLGQGQPNDIKFDPHGNAWISNISANDEPGLSSVVVRLGAGHGGTAPGQIYPSQTSKVSFGLPFAGLEAMGGGHLWVIVGFHGPTAGDNRVAVVDTGTQVARVLKLDESATSVAYGYDTAWVGTYGTGAYGTSHFSYAKDDSRIEAFRAGQSKPSEIVLEKHGATWGPTSIAVGDGAVWAVTYSSHQLVKIDPITLRVDWRRTLPAGYGGIAIGAGGVWVESDHSISKIDPQSHKILRTFTLVHGNVGQLCGLAATARRLWVTSGDVYCDTIGS
jgi:DNA-binding SARP family transcriptional activator/streptogramin lyase